MLLDDVLSGDRSAGIPHLKDLLNVEPVKETLRHRTIPTIALSSIRRCSFSRLNCLSSACNWIMLLVAEFASGDLPLTHRRSWVAWMPRFLAVVEILYPCSVTSLTAPSLGSSVNFLRTVFFMWTPPLSRLNALNFVATFSVPGQSEPLFIDHLQDSSDKTSISTACCLSQHPVWSSLPYDTNSRGREKVTYNHWMACDLFLLAVRTSSATYYYKNTHKIKMMSDMKLSLESWRKNWISKRMYNGTFSLPPKE